MDPDFSAAPFKAKISNAEQLRVHTMLVIGGRDMEAGAVSVRLFKLLFEAATQTLLEFGAERLTAQLGLTAVLHTWSQTLGDHYLLHGIVTGGGVAQDQSRWVATSPHICFRCAP